MHTTPSYPLSLPLIHTHTHSPSTHTHPPPPPHTHTNKHSHPYTHTHTLHTQFSPPPQTPTHSLTSSAIIMSFNECNSRSLTESGNSPHPPLNTLYNNPLSCVSNINRGHPTCTHVHVHSYYDHKWDDVNNIQFDCKNNNHHNTKQKQL